MGGGGEEAECYKGSLPIAIKESSERATQAIYSTHTEC